MKDVRSRPLTAMICMALGLIAIPVTAHDGLWSAGIQTRGVADFEPGDDYVTGFEAGYSDARILKQRLELQFTFLTSRAQVAVDNLFAQDNSLKQDWYLLSPVWHFRRKKLFDPTLQLDLGYQRYDFEDEAIFGDLRNTTWIYGAGGGFNFNFGPERRYVTSFTLGYQVATSSSNIVYPLHFNLGFSIAFP